MSSVPPPPPGSYPPPPPPPPGMAPAGSLPWESQGINLSTFVETAKMFIMAPADAWSRTPEKGDLMKPLLFSVILGWVGAIFSAVYGTVMGNSWLRMVPPQFQRYATMGAGGGVILKMILAPIAIAIGLFIGAAIFHLCFMMVGALSTSTSGFEGTFRMLAYSGVASVAYVVPIVGPLLGLVWRVVLMVMGVTRLHRTTQGKAIVGVLLPLVLCCACVVIAVVFGAAAIFSGLKR